MPFILKYHTFRFFSMRLYIILCDFKSSFKIFSKICRIFCILFQYGRQIRPYIDFLFLLNYNSRKRSPHRPETQCKQVPVGVDALHRPETQRKQVPVGGDALIDPKQNLCNVHFGRSKPLPYGEWR